nr:hypothetical protein BHI3_16550 [Bacteriovorax sp. HI3]
MRLQILKNRPLKLLAILTVTMHSFAVCAFMSPSNTNAPAQKPSVVTSEIVKVLQKDCVTCTPDLAPGFPLTGNRSARAIAMVSDKAMSQEEQSFFIYLSAYCMTVPGLRGEKDFNKKMLDSMKETAVNGNIDGYWQEAGCEPMYIAQTMSPLIHVIAENSTDRMQYMLYLKKYYTNKKDPGTFRKIINSKNSQGQTVLDYIQYAFNNRRFANIEEKGLNEFIKFLCENGAEYSKSPGKRCPAEYLTLYK